MSTSLDPQLAYERIRQAVGSLGEVQNQDPVARTIAGVVPAGFANLNPADVSVTISASGDSGATIEVEASALEGLIKQHTAAKAVDRVLDAFHAASTD